MNEENEIIERKPGNWKEDAIERAQENSAHKTEDAKRQKKIRLKNLGEPLETDFLERYSEVQRQEFRDALLRVPQVDMTSALRLKGNKVNETVWNVNDLDELFKDLYHIDQYETPMGIYADSEQRADIERFQRVIEAALIERAEAHEIHQAIEQFDKIGMAADILEKKWGFCLNQPGWNEQVAMLSNIYLELTTKCVEAILRNMLFNEDKEDLHTALRVISRLLEEKTGELKKKRDGIVWQQHQILEDFKYYLALRERQRQAETEKIIRQQVYKNLEGLDIKRLMEMDTPNCEIESCRKALEKEKGEKATKLVEATLQKLIQSNSLNISGKNPADWWITYNSMFTPEGKTAKSPIERKDKKIVELRPKDGTDIYVQKKGASKNGWRLMSVPDFAKQWTGINSEKPFDILDERLDYLKIYYTEARKRMLCYPDKQKSLEAVEVMCDRVRSYMNQILLTTFDAKTVMLESSAFLKLCVTVWKLATLKRLEGLDSET